MKFYWSFNSIPELEGLSSARKWHVWREANKGLWRTGGFWFSIMLFIAFLAGITGAGIYLYFTFLQEIETEGLHLAFGMTGGALGGLFYLQLIMRDARPRIREYLEKHRTELQDENVFTLSRAQHLMTVIGFSYLFWMLVGILTVSLFPVYPDQVSFIFREIPFPKNQVLYLFPLFGLFFGSLTGAVIHRILRVAHSKPEDGKIPARWFEKYMEFASRKFWLPLLLIVLSAVLYPGITWLRFKYYRSVVDGRIPGLERSRPLSVRLWTIDRISKSPDSSMAPQLAAALFDSDGNIRWMAAEALCEAGDATAVDALLKAISDNSQYVAKWAIIALGKIGDPKTVEKLNSMIKKQHQHATLAAWAAAEIGDRNSIDAIMANLGGNTRNIPGDIWIALFLARFDAEGIEEKLLGLAEKGNLGGALGIAWRKAIDNEAELRAKSRTPERNVTKRGNSFFIDNSPDLFKSYKEIIEKAMARMPDEFPRLDFDGITDYSRWIDADRWYGENQSRMKWDNERKRWVLTESPENK
ncbi:MAG: HEAT repeat domain-containing protein [Planctomycetota bacterium]|jgi:hypothetical protein